MIVVGIDPGSVSGALACIDNRALASTCDIPHVERQINAYWLVDELRRLKPDAVVVEHVHSMPKQGVSSTFAFGTAYGTILGVVAALNIPLHRVPPATWKKHFNLAGKDDEAVRGMAVRRFPFAAPTMILKKHHNRASALMIAQWFIETQKVPA